MSQQDQNKKKYPLDRVNALLSMQRALLCEVAPTLRAASIDWDDATIHLYFYYDGEVSDEDRDSAECVATEVIASYPEYELDVHINRCDFPQQIPDIGERAFRRREL